MDKYLEKLRDEDTKKGINESTTHWFRRRFSIDELNQLVKDVEELIEYGTEPETAIYDAVREFIKEQKFFDIDEYGDDQSYWNSYLKYEEPLVKYVKEKLGYE